MAGWRVDGRRGSSSAASRARRRALVACGVLVDGAECRRLDATGEGEGQQAGVQASTHGRAASSAGQRRSERTRMRARVPVR